MDAGGLASVVQGEKKPINKATPKLPEKKTGDKDDGATPSGADKEKAEKK